LLCQLDLFLGVEQWVACHVGDIDIHSTCLTCPYLGHLFFLYPARMLADALGNLSTVSSALFPQALALPTLCLAKGDAPLLALGHEPALLFGVTQDSVPGDPFSKTFQQTLW
jgi:hypothetical protein